VSDAHRRRRHFAVCRDLAFWEAFLDMTNQLQADGNIYWDAASEKTFDAGKARGEQTNYSTLSGPPILTIAYLWNLPRGDTRAVPYAAKKLESKVTLIRVAAARGLGSIGPSADPAVPDLIDALKDRAPSVASSAAWALGAIQSQRPEAVNALIDALGSRDGEVRRYAAYALSQYGPKAQRPFRNSPKRYRMTIWRTWRREL
jgi:hypothetical protein